MKNEQKRVDQSVHSSTESTNRNPGSRVVAGREEALKWALVRKLSAQYPEIGDRLVYQAVNEADALASLTSVPLLVLPSLAEEKVQTLAAWTAHQRFLRDCESAALAA